MVEHSRFSTRASHRLPGFDYSTAGVYFLTMCTAHRACLFGTVNGDEVVLNSTGLTVAETWLDLPTRFAGLLLDEFVIMPNHVHGLVIITDAPPNPDSRDGGLQASRTPSVPQVVRAFKSISAITVNRLLNRPSLPLWQARYLDHIVRDGKDMKRLRNYIRENPARWAEDEDNLRTGG